MKLAVIDNDGNVHEAIDDVEELHLDEHAARSELATAVSLAIDRAAREQVRDRTPTSQAGNLVQTPVGCSLSCVRPVHA